jgi:hypothetical protein
MDFLFWSTIILVLVVVIAVLVSLALMLTVFLGPPDGFDIDVNDNLTTKESNYDDTEHKKHLRKKLRGF